MYWLICNICLWYFFYPLPNCNMNSQTDQNGDIVKIWRYNVIELCDKNPFWDWQREEKWYLLSKEQLESKTVYKVKDQAWLERMIFFSQWKIIDTYKNEIIKSINSNHIKTIKSNWEESIWIAQEDGWMVNWWWIVSRLTAEDDSPHWYQRVHAVMFKDADGYKKFPVYHKKNVVIKGAESLVLNFIFTPIHYSEWIENGLFDTTKRISDLQNRLIISMDRSIDDPNIQYIHPLPWIHSNAERDLLKNKKELIPAEW